MSSLNTDMFMEHPVVQRRDSDNSRRIMPAANPGLDFDMLDQGWRLPSTTAITTRPTGLMAQGTAAGQYRSLSRTSSSSVSSQEDYASARTLSIDSPEDPGHVPLKTSNSPSNSTSSTQRRYIHYVFKAVSNIFSPHVIFSWSLNQNSQFYIIKRLGITSRYDDEIDTWKHTV